MVRFRSVVSTIRWRLMGPGGCGWFCGRGSEKSIWFDLVRHSLLSIMASPSDVSDQFAANTMTLRARQPQEGILGPVRRGKAPEPEVSASGSGDPPRPAVLAASGHLGVKR